MTIYSGGCMTVSVLTVFLALVVAAGILKEEVERVAIVVGFVGLGLTAYRLVTTTAIAFRQINPSKALLLGLALSSAAGAWLLFKDNRQLMAAGIIVLQVSVQSALCAIARQAYDDVTEEIPKQNAESKETEGDPKA